MSFCLEITTVYLYSIAHGLKGVEREPHGQQQVQQFKLCSRNAGDMQQVVNVRYKEIIVLEHPQYS